jgi:hypothetical protein
VYGEGEAGQLRGSQIGILYIKSRGGNVVTAEDLLAGREGVGSIRARHLGYTTFKFFSALLGGPVKAEAGLAGPPGVEGVP